MGSEKDASSQGGDYQKYMDYSKYMSQGGGKSGKDAGNQGGDYQKYMDYSKYMSQGGGKSSKDAGSQGGDYSNYYKKYMSQGANKSESDATIDSVASEPNRPPSDNSSASAPASAPEIALAALGDSAGVQSVPANPSSVSATAPLDAI